MQHVQRGALPVGSIDPSEVVMTVPFIANIEIDLDSASHHII
jgi:hypothetical protein